MCSTTDELMERVNLTVTNHTVCKPLSSVQFSHWVTSDSLRPHEPQHARPPCPSPTPGVYPSSCPLSQWCHPTISSSVVPFSSCPQSFAASGSFPMSQLFASGGQSIGVSASTSVLPSLYHCIKFRYSYTWFWRRRINIHLTAPQCWAGWLLYSGY